MPCTFGDSALYHLNPDHEDELAGIRLPAEWEPQSGVQLTWPHANTDWAECLDLVEPCFAAIGREISLRERLLVACPNPEHVHEQLVAAGANMNRVEFATAPSNDTWARDHGPITVIVHGSAILQDFHFNGWGGKFEHALDDALSSELHRAGAYGEVRLHPIPLVLEGGSIESDGQGTILTTSRCLLSSTRNPDLDRAGVEMALNKWLGASSVHWLDHGYLAGDDTDSHIDTLARFCDEQTIAYVACDDPSDEHYDELQAMAKQLRALHDRLGNPYRLHSLPMPRPCYDSDGQRLPATYANFLVINGAVLVPTYDDPADDTALSILGACFPGREIVGIDCRSLVLQHGSLHCVTMQFPEGVLG
ncbi:MAG: agmatine deiminase family protein [Candidatus Hydrogenedentes bacterium]|nr:agmatine deiminase family protein [Candidatus Hydrogenedentota bacterium]